MATQTNLISKELRESIDQRVRTVDEDRWLSSRFAPLPQREWLVALYAFDHELSRVPHVVSEQMLGQIRFQWWRESLDGIFEWVAGGSQPRAHDVTAALAEMVLERSLERRWLDAMIDAHEAAFLGDGDIGEAHTACLNAGIILLDGNAESSLQGVISSDAIIPDVLRPALAYLALRPLYQDNKEPGPIQKRWRLVKTVATGRLR